VLVLAPRPTRQKENANHVLRNSKRVPPLRGNVLDMACRIPLIPEQRSVKIGPEHHTPTHKKNRITKEEKKPSKKQIVR